MSEQSAAHRFVVAISLHTAAAACLYAWQVLGHEPAGNLFLFWLWFVAAIFNLNLLVLGNPPKRRHPRVPTLLVLNLSAWLAFTVALVWLGYVVLPAFMLSGLLFTHALQQKYNADGTLKGSDDA